MLAANHKHYRRSLVFPSLAIALVGSLAACSAKKIEQSNPNTGVSFENRCLALLGEHPAQSGLSQLEVTSANYISSTEQLPQNSKQPINHQDFKAFCQLQAYFERRTGADDKPYAIGLGLNLPKDWNGRFLFQGGGALNGLIRPPMGAHAAGDTPALYRGFAVATTDSGHQSDSIFNHDFFADQQALLNFYGGAVYKSTLQAQRMVKAFYQTPSKRDFFVGCSTGGREAMTMSQRYPDLFDGIIAGAPAMRTNLSEVADLFMATTLREITDSGQQPPFNSAQQKAITQELLAQCDGLDGLQDGLIMAPQHCQFDTSQLACAGNEHQSECLSQKQISALDTAFAGPKTESHSQVYPGFYFDTGISAAGNPGVPGILQAKAGPLGAPREQLPFNLQRELDIAKNFPLAAGNATLTNLSGFSQNGGKLIFFHGVSDPWFSAKDTVTYFTNLQHTNGGAARVNEWSQLYLIPGMGHCSGGEITLDTFDLLTPLVSWVETQNKPSNVVATGDTLPNIARPLCPYPKVATYSNNGAPEAAGSFYCQ